MEKRPHPKDGSGAQPVEGERIWKKHIGESEQNSQTNKDGGRTMF